MATHEKSKDRLFSTKEKVVAAVTAAGLFLAGWGILKLAQTQERGISESLSQQVGEVVVGFAGLAPDEGETPQTAFGEVRNAKVMLTDGTTCDVQYTTPGDTLWTEIFPDRAELVSTGTCPTE